MGEALHTYGHRPERLAAAFAYAEDRASFLDVRGAVERAAAAFDPEPVDTAMGHERAELILSVMSEAAEAALARRMESPDGRRAIASVVIALAVPS
jgi:hypothetical protein